jgi:hypothetical protein
VKNTTTVGYNARKTNNYGLKSFKTSPVSVKFGFNFFLPGQIFCALSEGTLYPLPLEGILDKGHAILFKGY